MRTKVDLWTDGPKSVRRDLNLTKVQLEFNEFMDVCFCVFHPENRIRIAGGRFMFNSTCGSKKLFLIKPKNVCFGTVINNLQIGNERKSLKDKLFNKLFSII